MQVWGLAVINRRQGFYRWLGMGSERRGEKNLKNLGGKATGGGEPDQNENSSRGL